MLKVRRSVSIILALAMILSIVQTAFAAPPRMAGTSEILAPFLDIIGTKYQESVGYLYKIGVVSGKTATAFEPSDRVTRAQMAAFVVRALGMSRQAKTFSGVQRFNDVPVNHWAAGEIAVANQLGIVTGAQGLFRPDDPVTYAEAATMLVRATGQEKGVKGEWPTGHILRANELGLLKDIEFASAQPATRGDVALMLAAAIFSVENPSTGKTLSQTVFKVPTRLTILPAEEYIFSGEIQLRAVGYDWYNREIDVQPGWTVTGGTGSISSTGVLSVSGKLPVTIRAAVGDLSASKTYQIVKEFSISPSTAFVSPNGSIQFTAEGSTTDGKKVTVSPTWSVISGNASINDSGLLVAKGDGTIRVKATLGQNSVEALVTVVSKVEVSPKSIVATSGEKIQFTARGYGSDGKPFAIQPNWSRTSGDGSLDSNGLFVAGTSLATVKASVGSFSDSATVQVLSRIEVAPGTAALNIGENMQFTAKGYSKDGSLVPISPKWAVNPVLGPINESGLMVATGAGKADVTATHGSITGKATLTVAGDPVGILVTASPSTIPANGKSTSVITARVVDANGNTTKKGVTSLLFSLSASNLGSLTANQVQVTDGLATVTFTPSTQAGTVQVLVSAPGTSLPGASAIINTTAPVISKVVLSAYPNPLAADGSSLATLTATLTDMTGAPISNSTGQTIIVNLNPSGSAAGYPTSTTLSISPGASSATTQFRASSVLGSTVVYGSSPYPVESVAITTINVGPATHLKIRGGITETKADGTSEMVVQVEIRDANGNIRTSDNSTTLALSAISGSNTLTIPSVVAANGVGTFRIRTTVAGVYDLRAWSLSSPLTADQTTATFIAGPAAKLTLAVEPTNSLAADTVSTARLVARVTDVNGNLVPGASHSVTFTKIVNQGVTVMPTNNVVSAVNGVATLVVTSTAGVGTDTYTAAAPGLQSVGSVTVTTRITGVPVRVAVQPITNGRVGETLTVKVYVLDALGQVVTSANGRTVFLNTSSGTAVTNSPQKTDGGIATFTLKDTKAGVITVTANSEGVDADLTGRSVTISVGQPDHIVLKASPDSLAADGISRSTITAEVVDLYGNSVSNGHSMTLNVSDTRYGVLSSNYLYTGGFVSLTSTTTPGLVTITGTSSTYPVTPITIGTYIAGSPAKVMVEQPTSITAGNGYANQVQIRVRILDANGNLLTSLNSGSQLTSVGLTITGNSGSTTTLSVGGTYGLGTYGFYPNGTTSGSANVSNGIATFTFTNTKAETVTLNPIVYYNGQALTPVSATMTTLAGPATRLMVEPATVTIPAGSSVPVTLAASITDVYGNLVSGVNDTITFRLSSNNYVTLPTSSVVSTSGGRANITVTSQVHAVGGTTVITATSTNTGLTGTATLITDTLPSTPTVYVSDNYGVDTVINPSDLGVKVTVTVLSRNSEQRIFAYVNGVSVPLYTTVSSTTTIDSIPAGSTVLVGYIKKADLGWYGIKQIQAVSSTPIGLSPLSTPVEVNYVSP